MKAKVFKILFVILVASCGKPDSADIDKKSDHSKIINHLNQGRADDAIQLIDAELVASPNDVDLRYYKVQAHSLKANVDIYSLFPILKMKLFEVAMDEWAMVEKYQKMNKKKIEDLATRSPTLNVSTQVLNQMRANVEARPVETFHYEFHDEYLSSYYNPPYEYSDPVAGDRYSRPGYTYCYYTYKVSSKDFIDKESRLYGYINRTFYDQNLDDQGCKNAIIKELENENIQKRVKEFVIAEIDGDIKKQEQMALNQRYLKAVFALYESVDVFENLPGMNIKSIQDMKIALQNLEIIKKITNKESRLGRNARQQMGLLAGFLITGSLKSAVEFKNVEEPIDILCLSNAGVLVDHYEALYLGTKYMFESVRDTEFVEKNKDTFEKAYESFKLAPERIDESMQKDVKETIEKEIERNC